MGSAYDRTLYGFQIETTPEQDDQFIAHYNAAPNTESYRLVTRNCADFVREAINFYYPKAVKRSLIADWDISTPKHAAKGLAQYSAKHPELSFTAFVIPQVPGTIRRSKPVRGLVESVFKAKKYELPLLALYPAAAGGLAAAYIAKGRFSPSDGARMYAPGGVLEEPLDATQRRSYAKGLEEFGKSLTDAKLGVEEAAWQKFVSRAILQWDKDGHPALLGEASDGPVLIGLTRANLLSNASSRPLAQGLLLARLRGELKKGGPPKISGVEFHRDWNLLKIAFNRPDGVDANTFLESRNGHGTD